MSDPASRPEPEVASSEIVAPEEWSAWRARRRESLGGPTGWVTLVALEWLEAGRTTVGSRSDANIVITHAPSDLGTVIVEDGQARFVAASNAGVTHDGAAVSEIALVPDTTPGGPTVLTAGSLTFHSIERSGRLALRVKDRDAEARARFVEPRVWPYDASFRVRARFAPSSPPRNIAIQNVLGTVEDTVVAGTLELELDGRSFSLAAVWNDDRDPSKGLFVLLRDRTSDREESYPAGRYLDVPLPVDGVATADFNFLETPPCAYTDFATCPLPPRENDLDVDLRAGEQNPRFDH